MWAHANGVHALDAVEMVAKLRADTCTASVGSIDVDPCTEHGGNIGDVAHRVNDIGRRGAHGCADICWHKTSVGISLHYLEKFGRIERVVSFRPRGDGADVRRVEACKATRL